MSEPPTQPLKLLLSAFALRTWGARIESPAGGATDMSAGCEAPHQFGRYDAGGDGAILQ